MTGRRQGRISRALEGAPWVVRAPVSAALACARALVAARDALAEKDVAETDAPPLPRPRLGQVMVARYGLSRAELDEALTLQQEIGRPLGEVLTMMGRVSARDVATALATMHAPGAARADAGPQETGSIPSARTSSPDEDVTALLMLDERDAAALDIVPLPAAPGGPIRFAAAGPLDADTLDALEARYGAPVEIELLAPEEVKRARHHAYRQLLTGAADTETEPCVALAPDDVDLDATETVGLGFCLFYGLLPRKSPASPAAGPKTRAVAAAFPVHPSVVAQLAARLGAAIEIKRVPLLDIDVALAMLQGDHTENGRASLDVLDVLAAVEMEQETDASSTDAAIVHARTFGLHTTPGDPGPLDWPLLPPELRGRHPIFVHGIADKALVLATARPTPQLARSVAGLYPGWAISWEVALPARAEVETEEHTWTPSASLPLTN